MGASEVAGPWQAGSRAARAPAPPHARVNRRTAVRQRRAPLWVLAAGGAAFLACTGWVAAQPLPATQPSPALSSAEAQLKQAAQQYASVQAQAQQWQAQRASISATLQQEENQVAALTGQAPPASTGGTQPSVQMQPPSIAMTRGS